MFRGSKEDSKLNFAFAGEITTEADHEAGQTPLYFSFVVGEQAWLDTDQKDKRALESHK